MQGDLRDTIGTSSDIRHRGSHLDSVNQELESQGGIKQSKRSFGKQSIWARNEDSEVQFKTHEDRREHINNSNNLEGVLRTIQDELKQDKIQSSMNSDERHDPAFSDIVSKQNKLKRSQDLKKQPKQSLSPTSEKFIRNLEFEESTALSPPQLFHFEN